MKIAFKHILKLLIIKPEINELSEKLFQLGHEHEIENEIFNMEFTPNRGDCLSLLGLARDLNIFYGNDLNFNQYKEKIPKFEIDFINKSAGKCPEISFINIEINGKISPYKDYLESYFSDLELNKNNFFTDISNYLAYEMGQPTHCYDFNKISGEITLEESIVGTQFTTLQNKIIDLEGSDLIFTNQNQVINLAGIMGGLNTSCSKKTNNVLIECAFFRPDSIIGKALKYNLHSDASHKFERGVDLKSQEDVIRRFIHIVSEHVNITKIQLYKNTSKKFNEIELDFDLKGISKILGIEVPKNLYIDSLTKLGFKVDKNIIKVPSYRNDILQQNDLAEEIARVIGYDNIRPKEINIPFSPTKSSLNIENSIKSLLIDNGFYEVINSPFTGKSSKNSIKVDNPLDSNRQYLRTNLIDSLIENLLFNERRQKDSIKIFEIADVYTYSKVNERQRMLGIVASGRVGKNYLEFSKKINIEYLSSIFEDAQINTRDIEFKQISRADLDTKLGIPIVSLEINLDKIPNKITNYLPKAKKPIEFIQYSPISEFPLTARDISFSVEEMSSIMKLNDLMKSYHNDILKEIFIFDYYVNEKKKEIKIGYRLIFQANNKTLNDIEVDSVINDIIYNSKEIDSVKIPGL